jgi:hypothetical protein
MKKIKQYLSVVIAAGLMLFSACEKDAIDPLTGKYPVPENYTLATLVSQDMAKGATTRTFTLELGSATEYLTVEFVGPRLNYFVPAGNYTIAARNVAKAGNYIAGDANGGTYWTAGSAPRSLIDGTIAVKADGDAYSISSTVMLEDRSIIKIAFTGAIVFEPDPPAYTYTLVTETPAIGGGMAPAPIAGSRMNKITVLSEGIQVAYLEVVTADNATSLSGSYVVTDGINATGQANNGYYMDLSQYGMGIMKGGSYYMDGDVEMFIRAGGGNIDIADNNGTLTITGSNLPIQDISTGMAFGILPTRGSINYQDVTRTASALPMNNLLAASVTDLAAVSGGFLTGYTVTLKFGEAGLTATPNMFGGLDIGGTGKYVSIDFKRDAGTLPAGTYTIKADAEAAVGDAIAGYYLDLGGFGFNSGCLWISVDNSVPTETFIIGGTVVVAENGGMYTGTVNATTAGGEAVSAVYTGAITLP